jgi:hypothetical protein
MWEPDPQEAFSGDTRRVDKEVLDIFHMMEELDEFAHYFGRAAVGDGRVTRGLIEARAAYDQVPDEYMEKSKSAGVFAAAVARAVFGTHPKARGGEWKWSPLGRIAVDALSRRGGAFGEVEHAARETYVGLLRIGLRHIGAPPWAADDLVVDSKRYYLSDEYLKEWTRIRFTSYAVEEVSDEEVSAVLVGPDGRPLKRGPETDSALAACITTINDEVLRVLADEPDLLREISPRRFEEVIAGLLDRLGYRVRLTQASRDEGADVLAFKDDPLGTFLYIVECKRYAPHRGVGIGLVQRLSGVVQGRGATAGILATTSYFTKPAKDFQKSVRFQLSLRDFDDIVSWLRAARDGFKT